MLLLRRRRAGARLCGEQPAGPYNYTGSITEGPNPFNPSGVSTSCQQTLAFSVDNDQVVWVGDRWQSGPAPEHLKGEDFTAWFVLNFTANGTVLPVAWADNTVIDV